MIESQSVATNRKRRWYHRRLRLLLVLAAVGAVVCGCVVFRRDVATWYVARQFRVADTPEAELTACIRMNHWGPPWAYGYSVRAEDASGEDIRPWVTGQWDRVAAVTVTWDNGTTVRRTILDERSLIFIFGE